MDEFTKKKHENPDYIVHIWASGVVMPAGNVNWLFDVEIDGTFDWINIAELLEKSAKKIRKENG